MRTLLICHEDAASRSRGAGAVARVVLDLRRHRRHPRARRPAAEAHRARDRRGSAGWRFLDVLAFRAVLRAGAGRRRPRAGSGASSTGCARWFPDRPDAPEIVVASPNSAEAAGVHRARSSPTWSSRAARRCSASAIFSIPRARHLRHAPGHLPGVSQRARLFLGDGAGDARQRRHDAAADRSAASTPAPCSATSASTPTRRSRTSSRSIASCSIISTRFATRCWRSRQAPPRRSTRPAEVGRLGSAVAQRAHQNASLRPAARQDARNRSRRALTCDCPTSDVR